MKVLAAEATGPIKTKLHPRLSTSAQSIWIVFLLLTVLCQMSFKLLGMGWFDSVNYAMTTMAGVDFFKYLKEAAKFVVIVYLPVAVAGLILMTVFQY